MKNQEIVKSVNFYNTSLPLKVAFLLNMMVAAVNNIVDCDWEKVIDHNSKNPLYSEFDKQEDILYSGVSSILKEEYVKGVEILRKIKSPNRAILWIINNPKELRRQVSRTGYI